MRRLLVTSALIASACVPAAADARTLQGNLGSARGASTDVARRALARHAPALGVQAARFRFERVERSLLGTHVRGRRHVGGVPVAGTGVNVLIARGRVRWIAADDVRATGRPSPSPVAATTARAAALGHLGVALPYRVSTVRELRARGSRLVDVISVSVLSLRPARAATVDVSARDGRILGVRDDLRRADGRATLFDPNPVVTKRDSALRQPGLDESGIDTDLDSAELTAQLVELPVLGYDAALVAAGRLQGPWVDVLGPEPLVADADGKFDYTRGRPGFEALMAYAHLDRYQRYLQDELGFKGDAAVNAERQEVLAQPVAGFDNSFYQPGNDIVAFGAGGVDDAEDADVVLHEYGHAMQDDQVPGWGAEDEGGAMGEGFGDFQAAAYYARTGAGFNDPCIADWDATSYSSDDPPCLRRADRTKVYPKDAGQGVHADGEIWSSFLWRLRDRLGSTAQEKSDRSLQLVIASHELLTPEAKFADAVAALKAAASRLGHPEWRWMIDAEGVTTGFVAPGAAEPPPAAPAPGAPATPSPTPQPGSGAPATPKAKATCTRRPRLSCRVSGGPAGRTTARLLRGRSVVARGSARNGRVRFTGRPRVARAGHVLELRAGKRVVARLPVRIR